MRVAAGEWFSMNTTSVAPRLSASMPTAPVPANTSRKRHPGTRPARTLKSDSRRRSLVGRRARPLRLLSGRLRNVPALKRFLLDRLLGEGERFLAGEFEKLAIADRVGHVEAELAGLPGAKKLTGAAKLEIGFGDF